MIQAWLEFLNSNWFDQSTFNIILNSVIGCGQQSTPKLHLLLVPQLFFLISWFMFSVYKLELFYKKIVLNDLFTVMIGFIFQDDLVICSSSSSSQYFNLRFLDFQAYEETNDLQHISFKNIFLALNVIFQI